MSQAAAAAEPFVQNIEEYFPWQAELMEVLNGPVDPRAVWWIWEPSGNIGKTTFMKHVTSAKPDLRTMALSGKATDMMNGIVEYNKETGKFPNVIFVPLPRSFHAEWLSYAGLEAIKDMYFFSGKYASGMVCGPPPHMMIFANWPPPSSDEFSADRWRIRKIVNGYLVDEAAPIAAAVEGFAPAAAAPAAAAPAAAALAAPAASASGLFLFE